MRAWPTARLAARPAIIVNDPPVAVAGADRTAAIGEPLAFDGSGSQRQRRQARPLRMGLRQRCDRRRQHRSATPTTGPASTRSASPSPTIRPAARARPRDRLTRARQRAAGGQRGPRPGGDRERGRVRRFGVRRSRRQHRQLRLGLRRRRSRQGADAHPCLPQVRRLPRAADRDRRFGHRSQHGFRHHARAGQPDADR